FARDFHMHGELALRKDGTMLGLRVKLLADEGAFHADAQPTKFKVGLFHIVSGSYDLPAAHVEADGAYTNKAPGGVAYRCSFRVTEASYLIERLVQNAAYELDMDPAELRVHPTGKAILKLGVKTQGQGHETTFAQIVASELGIQPEDVLVQHGDTDNTPYGLGTYASRSTPTAGAATAMVARKLREKARKIAAHLLEVSEDDLEWETGKFFVKGAPDKAKTIGEIAFAAYTNFPDGL